MDSRLSFRERIERAVREALEPLPDVLAAWEGGSVAFDAVDQYSDLDLNVVVSGEASTGALYSAVEVGLNCISPITHVHEEPPGRYYKLRDGGEYLLLDLCFFREETAKQYLDRERHGKIRMVFDKGDWLSADPRGAQPWKRSRAARLAELEAWYSVSQTFVWKAVHRQQPVEAFAAYWAYTLRPLVELLGMKYRPERWDFGLRYLDRDLPEPVYARVRDAIYARDLAALSEKLIEATRWGEELIAELRSADP